MTELTRDQQLLDEFKAGLDKDGPIVLAQRIAVLEDQNKALAAASTGADNELLTALTRAETLEKERDAAITERDAANEDANGWAELDKATKQQIEDLKIQRDAAIDRAEKAEGGEKRAKASLTKATAPVKLRKIGAVDAIEGDDDETAIEKIRAAIGKADDVQIAFSDGTREVPGLSPVNVAGDAWKDHPNGLMLSEPVEIEGPGEGTSVTIDGYALMLDGKQFAYARRSTPLQIAPGQRMKITDDIIF